MLQAALLVETKDTVSRPMLLACRTADVAAPKAKTHATDKKDQLDVQSKASGEARREKAAGGDTPSDATSESDQTNANKRAKEDHPEAPGPVIGMNDERGGKGH